MIFLQYHDYPDYLLECRATDDVPRFSILENPSEKIIVIPRVDSFKVHTNVLQCEKYVNKNNQICSNLHIKKEQCNEVHNWET